MSLKQIFVFTKDKHEVRGEAATVDALWVQMGLGISTSIHTFTRSLFCVRVSQGDISTKTITLSFSWVFPYKQIQQIFLKVVFSHSPCISEDLLCKIN